MIKPRLDNGFFLVLDTDPPVFCLKDWYFRKPGLPQWLALNRVRHRHACLLVQISWDHAPASRAAGMARLAARYTRRHPKHRVVFLANTPAERDSLAAQGLEAIWCSGSVFLSESVCRPEPGCPKPFDAVYDAVISPYKRHSLAAGVERLALITYRKDNSTPEYIADTLQTLQHATWLNGRPDGPLEWLDDHQVNRHVNRAQVGLALSAEEGHMYGSAQSLLTGLPVVSTESVGGRDIFYDEVCARLVPANADAVAAAVAAFCAHPPDPMEVRRRTLEKFAPHRKRFIDLLREITANGRFSDTWRGGWPDGLPHKLYGGTFSLKDNLRALARPGRPAPWITRRDVLKTPVQ